MKNADNQILSLNEMKPFLSSKDYYLDPDSKDQLQQSYRSMLNSLLTLSGKEKDEANQIVDQAMKFDEMMVPFLKTSEESSSYTIFYNPISFEEAKKQCKAFELEDLEKDLDIHPVTINIDNPDYFTALNELLTQENFGLLKSWLLVSLIRDYSPYLSDEFRIEGSAYNRLLSGVKDVNKRDVHAMNLTRTIFSEPVGIYYGETYFGEKASKDVYKIVEDIVEVYRERLKNNDWLSNETREMAIRKLDALTIRVGYPEKVRPIYSQLKIQSKEEGGTLLSNVVENQRILLNDMFSRVETPLDRSAWIVSGDTVNAFYNPMDNSVNLCAGILQDPIYNVDQSISKNYGGIGTVIGHEISHGFDNNGSQFDEYGNMNNWWTKEDQKEFDKRVQSVVDLFDGYELYNGKVNGKLTVGENLADLGGMSAALSAIKEKEDVDLKEFFINYATIWGVKQTPQRALMLLTLDVHGPAKLRCNLQVSQVDDFYTTFNIQAEDGIYIAPEKRIHIW